jgi:alpha-1,3-rhamnosyl/mannosyltransferase
MRLCVDLRYANDHFPGIGRMVTALAHEFAQHPAITQLELLINPHNQNTYLTIPTPSTNVRHHLLTAPPFSLAEAWQIRHIIATTHPDWCFTPYVRIPLIPFPCKLLVTIHDIIPLTTAAPWWVQVGLRAALTLVSLRATAITSVSTHAAQQIMATIWPARSIYAIPNGVAAQFFPQSSAIQPLPPAITGPFCVCVSSNQPHKNLATLVEAWAQAYERGEIPAHSQLVLAGHLSTHRAQPWRDARYQHIPIVVLATPDDTVLASLYHHATLFVLPSLAEGFGLPLVEAMANGQPIICHPHPAITAVVGDAAVLCDMHHPQQLAHEIATLWHDPSRQQQLRDAGYIQSQRFNWRTTADAYVQLMLSLE